MDEKRYRHLLDDTYARVDRAFEDVDPDLAEVSISQGTLTITYLEKQRLMLTPQPSPRQLWVAFRDRAWHFDWNEARGMLAGRSRRGRRALRADRNHDRGSVEGESHDPHRAVAELQVAIGDLSGAVLRSLRGSCRCGTPPHWGSSAGSPGHARSALLGRCSGWQVALARPAEDPQRVPLPPRHPLRSLRTADRSTRSSLSISGSELPMMTIGLHHRWRAASGAGDAEGGAPAGIFFGAGKCHLPNGVFAEQG